MYVWHIRSMAQLALCGISFFLSCLSNFSKAHGKLEPICAYRWLVVYFGVEQDHTVDGVEGNAVGVALLLCRRDASEEDCGSEETQATEQVCPPCACYPSTGDTIDITDRVSSLLSVSAS